MDKINIAIDGPAGAGKSTVAKMVAARLSYVYIDTGAMYRALAWRALQSHTDILDEASLTSLLQETEIEMVPGVNGNKVYVNNREVTEDIRSSEVTASVSAVSAHAGVRQKMVTTQQQLASRKGAVLDGRDIGTVVLPDAELKIFLTASVEERARRRHLENVEKGRESELQRILEDIEQRDLKDSTRKESPLKKAHDAVEIDSTNLSSEEVAAKICGLATERIQGL
ncbi:(d)CMP kinase [Bacillus piscicola]|uniref:(d)CMP kinase n=1 Tax=Bacillus piscicola TaxID=1632684 RepID=UPI001F090E42|nr:(d)CMP kinase [Bacillus piscicola]